MRIAKDQELLNQEERLRWISPALVTVYVLIIIGIIFIGRGLGESFIMPVIGIPLSVLLWSLIGSVAAILFRYYTSRITTLTEVSPEVTWLIARPLTGIIMGLVSYVAIVAGLSIFGAETQSNLGTPMVRPQLLWVVAFLAGFSDRFFEGFIRRLIHKLSGSPPESQPSDD